MISTEINEKQHTDIDVSVQSDTRQSQTSHIALDDLVMPQISGLEVLKEGTFSVDLEKTISDMLLVIKNMEAQLERVLNLNAAYEREIDTSKGMILKLKTEKNELLKKIEQMEIDIPSKREMQIEISHVEEEKNDALRRNRDLMIAHDSMKKEMAKLTDIISAFEEEKVDARMEINYLEVQLKTQQVKNKQYDDVISAMRGEKIALTEKLITLQDELKQAYSEKFKQYQEEKKHRVDQKEGLQNE
ncbi:MAG: hypothetical protein HQK75_08755 [Candidatus Magnetomorum sp.]|nr:hypothetical protein [Candidatus Magnetomorum sp.]